MFKNVKRILAAVLASAMVLSTGFAAVAADASPGTTTKPTYEDNEDSAVAVTGSDATKAYTHKEGEATISVIKKNNKKTYTTPASVTYKDLKYTVTGVRNGVFKNAKKAKTIVLGKTVVNLYPKAFKSLPKTVKIIKIKATKIKCIDKTAFKGLKKSQAKKIKVYVNKKMDKKSFDKLKKALKKAGFQAKNIKKKKL